MKNTRLSTPAGKIRAAVVDGMLWLSIKDIYNGFGYESHTGWSWHYTKGDHAEKYYRRYVLATGKLSENPNQRGVITVINLDGMRSILALKRIRENPVARAFHAWLERTYPVGATIAENENDDQINMFESNGEGLV